MTKNNGRRPRRHRAHQRRVDRHVSRHVAQLELPEYRFTPLPEMPRLAYPKGWTFGWLTPGRTAVLIGGGGFAVVVLCMALAKLLAG